ncbi:MAG: NAD-glutamate dehydrogenase domain-containing protein, partial [Pseudomonadota bacterium]
QLTEGVHARVHFLVKTPKGIPDGIDALELEERFLQAARTWPDLLRDCVVDTHGEERGLALFRRYAEAFPTSYQEHTLPQAAIFDIARIEEVRSTDKLVPNLYRPIEAPDDRIFFRIYNPDRPVPLSDVLPMMENMGLHVVSEAPAEIAFGDYDKTVWMHAFEARTAGGKPVDIASIKENFEEAFSRIWAGEMENDGFNRLVFCGGLTWRQIVVLRAYGKYLRQARFSFSQNYLEDALANHPPITANLVALFEARFRTDLKGDRGKAMAALTDKITNQLNDVERLDEDRILRRYVNLITSTLRTNFYQLSEEETPKPYLSLKLDSGSIDELPKPRPMKEIFVYSPRVEAVHLRGGPVARGGLRWSDRREDFRTEILGLMKSQMVKNAVIVPVGSKGGFVVKQPPSEGGREAFIAEGIECYKTMQRGLLDVTDNIVAGEVVPPTNVVRHDGDDPYLVVAADKGTATFSDIANSISDSYGFWMSDAYASGGSDGYDHKKMGITAKGAWESVKRHFRELGLNTQEEPFTVVGVGDMSGDVFGNGMLLSKHIRLQGAFNHLHIFIDPDPDVKKSFAERERLFEVARGSWDQYDTKLISKGGGVFDRKAKSIDLSPEAQAMLGVKEKSLTPDAVINAMLKSEADLLWFGGIGTYIKANDESHAEVGDKANDGLRVSAKDVSAKVIGEGANLGLTQRGRIDCAHRGVRLNTDFIDNSAGVDCSDHEVNIKILLNRLVADGDMTLKQRNTLLEKMTKDVSDLVLRDNYLQTQALSVVQADGAELLDQQTRLMRYLERNDRLDRAVEYLPNDEELTERLGNKQALVRPELSVLLSYAKITLYDDLLGSSLPDDPLMEDELIGYFPDALKKQHRDAIVVHPLRR